MTSWSYSIYSRFEVVLTLMRCKPTLLDLP